MKNLIYILLFVFCVSTLFAQDKKNYKSFYKTFKKEQSVFGITAPMHAAHLFIDFEEKELRKIIRKGRKVKVLVFEEDNSYVFKNINEFLPSSVYEEFLTIKDQGSKVKVLVKDEKEYVSEVVVLIKEENTLVTVGIYGKFTHDDILDLYKSI